MVKSAMRPVALVSVFALLFVPFVVGMPSSEAAPANKAEAKALVDVRFVEEAIELGEYGLAKGNLEKTLGNLTMAGSAVTPVAARTHVLLGIVEILGFKNTKGATEHFTIAITIQKDIALPSSATNRAKLVFGRAYEGLFPKINCAELMGLSHKALPLAQEGAPATIEAKLGKYLLDGSMMIMYRNVGSRKYQEAEMSNVEGCAYRGAIPGTGVNAPQVEYYLESRLNDGRPSARKGKAKSPFVINVSFGPVAEAKPPKTETVVATNPSEDTTTEPEVVDGVDESNDEIDLLLNKPKASKGSGCAGCSTGSGTSTSAWTILFVALFAFRRRRTNR